MLAGVKAVTMAIMAQALWALGPKAVKSSLTRVPGGVVAERVRAMLSQATLQ